MAKLTATQVQQAYIAVFNRPADPDGLDYWAGTEVESVESLVNAFTGTDEYKAQFTGKDEEQIVNSIYVNLFGRSADIVGLAYWSGLLKAGTRTLGNIAFSILSGANDGTKPGEFLDATVIANKVAAAEAFTAALAEPANAAAKAAYQTLDANHDDVVAVAAKWFAAITADNKDSSIASISSVLSNLVKTDIGDGGGDPGPDPDPGDGSDFYLGEGIRFEGNEKDNTITDLSGVVDDSSVIDGKGNTTSAGANAPLSAVGDKLNLTIADDNQGIAPTVKNVESVIVRGQHVGSNAHNGQDNNVYDGATLDADRFDGSVRWWESKNSRTDIKIEDVRIADDLLTKQVTVAFTESDPGHVDFALYFDPSSLRNSSETKLSGQLIATLYDPVASHGNLQDNSYDQLKFYIDKDLYTINLASDAATAFNTIYGPEADYDTLLAAVLAGIEKNPALKALGLTAKLAYEPIPIKVDGVATGVVAPNYIILTLEGHELGKGGWSSSGLFSSDGLIARYQDDQNPTATTTELVTSTVVLDYVGRGERGGDLVIGSLSTGATDTSLGVQEFDIHVKRDSRLEVISSTNNSLQVVNIVNEGVAKYYGAYERATGTTREGDLLVRGDSGVQTLLDGLKSGPFEDDADAPSEGGLAGGSPTSQQYIDGATDAQLNGYGFTDVRVIDAHSFRGQLDLSAILTANVVGKYLDLEDGAPALADIDNVNFDYKLGSNDDVFDLAISASNLEAAGATTREDFVLNIDGGAGNDVISTVIYGATGDPAVDNAGLAFWYLNHQKNANLSIDAGAGDDVVNTYGSGDWNVKLGTGNDTYYADNTGNKAIWVFNTVDQIGNDELGARNLNNLHSDVNDVYDFYDGELTVTFRTGVNFGDADAVRSEYESITVTIPSVGQKTSDLQINQAIKTAINTDPVLSKLLVATDGPANTLVVKSLIDNAQIATGLEIDIDVPTGKGSSAAWELKGDYVSAFANGYTGGRSTHTADNIIEAGKGDDVIVLGTGAQSNDTLVWTGAGNGKDTIVNFDVTKNVVQEMAAPIETPAAREVVTIKFGDVTVPAGERATVTIGGSAAININDGTETIRPGADIAKYIADTTVNIQTNEGTALAPKWVTWTTDYNAVNGTLVLTSVDYDNFKDLTKLDLVFSSNVTNDPSTTSSVTVRDGQHAYMEAAYETFTVDFAATNAVRFNTSFTFDGKTIDVALGDGEIEIAAKIVATKFDNWDVKFVDGANTGKVLFVAKDTGNIETFGLDGKQDHATGIDFGDVPTASPVQAEVTLVFNNANARIGSFVFDGHTIALAAVLADGPTVAAALLTQLGAAYNATGGTGGLVGLYIDSKGARWDVDDTTPGTIVFQQQVGKDLTADTNNLVIADADDVLANTSSLITTAYVPSFPTVFTVTIGTATFAGGETVMVAGVAAPTIGVGDDQDDVAVAWQAANTPIAVGGQTWNVTNPSGSTLVFTEAVSALHTATAANFAVTSTVAGVAATATPSAPTAATPAAFTLTFPAAVGTGVITVDGHDVEVVDTNTAAIVAMKAFEALGGTAGILDYTDASGTHWNVTHAAGTVTVVFTQPVAAPLAAAPFGVVDTDDVLVSFDIDVGTDGVTEVLDNGINAAVGYTGTASATDLTALHDGNDQLGDILYTAGWDVVRGDGDYLDFSSYEAAAVYVGSSLVAGTASGTNHKYIHLVESTTNAGEYTLTLNDAGTNGYDANDVILTQIGIVDFGETLTFIADNFILA